ncbi:unnamed protein product [Brassica rapa subsp. trilocularis]|uniref:Uncharacterized protein n=1 Tax=Brassica campestris TaxID=3711 RepID=M4FF12_BRACM
MEGTTAMVDQTYEFLATAMVRWKTYKCYSVDLTAVPRETSPKNIAGHCMTEKLFPLHHFFPDSKSKTNDSAPQDKTRQDETRQGKTRQDKTRQDRTRQDKVSLTPVSM